MTPETFNEMYWNSFPPKVRELRPLLEDLNHGKIPLEEVQETAFALAVAGFTVDPDVMRYGTTPYGETVRRIDQGYAWFPALGEKKNYDMAPGIYAGAPDWKPYDPNNPTKRFIPVSLDPAKWPPFDPPVVSDPPEIPAKPDFSERFTQTKFAQLVGDASPAGTRYSGPEGIFIKILAYGPAGAQVWWEKQ